MPTPPKLQAFDDMRFITNYLLAGCGVPSWLFVEFSQEPAADLAMLILLPDYEDIAQEIFDPKKGRRRKPARHGRKRKRRIGFPSADDMIGQRLRARLNPGNVLNIGLFRRAFPILNIYEGINFTAAVVEGFTDVYFEGLWGVLQADPTFCTEFSRLMKHDDFRQVIGGVGPPLQPVNIDIVDMNTGFFHTRNACRDRHEPYICNFTAFVVNNRTDVVASGNLALQNTTTGEFHESAGFVLQPGEAKSLEVMGKFGANEWCAWGFSNMGGFIDVYDRQILAYENVALPWA